jgi:hypothetical protein
MELGLTVVCIACVEEDGSPASIESVVEPTAADAAIVDPGETVVAVVVACPATADGADVDCIGEDVINGVVPATAAPLVVDSADEVIAVVVDPSASGDAVIVDSSAAVLLVDGIKVVV